MGTLYLKPQAMHEDLKVTIHDACLIHPAHETPKRSMFLSNIDKVLNFDVQMVHFFEGDPNFPPHIAAARIKNALKKLLAHYDFVAGRLNVNEESGRLEFDCNGAGAGFVFGSTELALADVGDLVYPNPAFRQLVTTDFDFLEKDDQPLCILQVTSFKCGGFVLGTSTNHTTFDGNGFKTFLENLASQSYGDDEDRHMATIPCNDRTLLAARSPPRVTYPHPELLKLNLPPGVEMAPPVFDSLTDQLSFEIFQLSPADINKLKNDAIAPADINQQMNNDQNAPTDVYNSKNDENAPEGVNKQKNDGNAPLDVNKPKKDENAPVEVDNPKNDENAPVKVNNPQNDENAPADVNKPENDEKAPAVVNKPKNDENAPTDVNNPKNDENAPPDVNNPKNDKNAPADVNNPKNDQNAPTDAMKPKNDENAPAGKAKVTGFNVVTAFLWKCKALSSLYNTPERPSTVLFAVDIRRRLNPPLPASYSGNAVLTAYATATCRDLEQGPFWKTVQMVYQGSARVTDNYAKSAIDWGEIHKGFPHGEFLVSSWWRLGFEEVEYPWGKPKYSCPVVYHRKDIILLFPDINRSNNGVNVLVALPPKEMERFKSLFHRFLAC